MGILNSFKLFRRRGSEFLCVLLATRDRQRYLKDVPVTLCFSIFVCCAGAGTGAVLVVQLPPSSTKSTGFYWTKSSVRRYLP